jgi:hypothetical protein
MVAISARPPLDVAALLFVEPARVISAGGGVDDDELDTLRDDVAFVLVAFWWAVGFEAEEVADFFGGGAKVFEQPPSFVRACLEVDEADQGSGAVRF